MQLPIREKYVDEVVGIWIIFGKHSDGSVDVADQARDVFTGVPRDVAEQLCTLQEEFRAKLYQLLSNFERQP